jgi:hypothetical protein
MFHLVKVIIRNSFIKILLITTGCPYPYSLLSLIDIGLTCPMQERVYHTVCLVIERM